MIVDERRSRVTVLFHVTDKIRKYPAVSKLDFERVFIETQNSNIIQSIEIHTHYDESIICTKKICLVICLSTLFVSLIAIKLIFF